MMHNTSYLNIVERDYPLINKKAKSHVACDMDYNSPGSKLLSKRRTRTHSSLEL